MLLFGLDRGPAKMLYLFDKFVLDTDRRELRRGAELVSVEPQVFDLLSFLIEQRNRVVSRDDLITAVWDGRIVSESALSARINAARTVIGDNGEEQHFIKTLPRKGIRFVADVREQGDDAERNTTGPAKQQGLAISDKPSIAVLPFTR